VAEQERPGTLAEALIMLQARLPRIPFNASIQFGNRTHKYADLASITDAIFPLLHDVGLAWVTRPTLRDDGQFVLAYGLLFAATAEELGGFYPLPNSTPQTIGSAITYARRYALCSILGIAAEDDDDAQTAETAAKWHPPADPRARRVTRTHGTAAEDTDWTTGPAADDTSGTITGDQLKEIRDRFVRNGIAVEDQPALVMSRLDLPGFRKFADLSRGQADNLIAYLRALENATEEGA
jgi:hypothetical protein